MKKRYISQYIPVHVWLMALLFGLVIGMTTYTVNYAQETGPMAWNKNIKWPENKRVVSTQQETNPLLAVNTSFKENRPLAKIDQKAIYAMVSVEETLCGNISTLPCDQVKVNLPFNLEFTGTEGGIADKNAVGTGFTMVAPYSATQRAGDDASLSVHPVIEGYVSENLTLDAAGSGSLIVKSTKGLAFTTSNNQLNTLGIGFNAGSQSFSVETVLVNPATGATNSAGQAGLWFGLDDKNFVKLVVVASATAGKSNIELRVERNDASGNTTSDQLITSTAITVNTSIVKLRLFVNKASNTVQGFYKIGANAEQVLGNTVLSVPTEFTTGLTSGLIANTTFGGIFASHRNGSTPLDFKFDNFSIQLAPENRAPVLTTTPADQSLAGGSAFNFAGGTFTDPDNDQLSYTATLESGAALPVWLTLNKSTGVFTGTAPLDASTLNLVVTAADPSGATATASFTITVNAPQEMPIFVKQEEFNTYGAGVLRTVAAGVWQREASSTTDVDIKQVKLSIPGRYTSDYSIDFSGKANTHDYLPITNNPLLIQQNQPFYFGTVFKISDILDNTQRIRSVLRVDGNTSTSTVYWIREQVSKVNGSLVAQIGLGGVNDVHFQQAITAEEAFQLVVKGIWNGSTTIDYWVAINPGLDESAVSWVKIGAVHTINKAPVIGRWFIGSTNIANSGSITAGRVSSDYSKVVIAAPVVANKVPASADKTITIDANSSYTFASADFAFTDEDAADALQKIEISTPTAGKLLLNGQEITEANTEIALADINKLSFAPAADAHGTPYATAAFRVSDGKDYSISYNFTFNVSQVNQAPVFAQESYSFSIAETAAEGDLIGSILATDADGDVLTYEITAGDESSKFVINTQGEIRVNASLNQIEQTTYTLTVTASDNSKTASTQVIIQVNEVIATNNPPVAVDIEDKTFDEGEEFTFTVSAFSDADNDDLTYSAKLVNGDELPGWLQFEANTLTFSGTSPQIETQLVISVRVTATDGKATAHSDFSITVNPVNVSNQAPVALADAAIAFNGTPISIDVLANDTDTDGTLNGTSVAIVIQPAKGIVSVDALTGTITYTPADLGNYTFSYTVADDKGAVSEPALVTVSTGVQVNFQDAATVAPAGWLKDYGQAFSTRSETGQGIGLQYGWKTPAGAGINLTQNGRNRLTSTNYNNATTEAKLQATLLHMQANNISSNFSGTKAEGIWEISVPNGRYHVTITVGDNSPDGSAADAPNHAINVEGVSVILDFSTPITQTDIAKRHKTNSVVAEVTDGLLTIDAFGGFNTKINSALIVPTAEPTAGVLVFDPQLLQFNAITGSLASSLTSNLTATPAFAVTPKLFKPATGAEWLTIPASNFGELSFTANPGSLAANTYTTTVTARAVGYRFTTLPVSLTLTTPKSNQAAFLTYTLAGKDGVTDVATHSISVIVDATTDITNLKADFTLSNGASAKVGNVEQISGTTTNDFNNPVTYVVLAEDGITSQEWTVTVSKASIPLALTPDSHDFVNQIIGTESEPFEFTLSNTGSSGSADIVITGITSSNPAFITPGLIPDPISAGESVAVGIIFMPTATAEYTGKITISYTYNGVSTSSELNLVGKGIAGCPPGSLLPCDQIVKNLPVNLIFDGTEGGLANTGFTMVDPPSARITADGNVTYPTVPGYEPSRLSFAGGQLRLNAAKGISFLKNGSGTGFSTNTNSQINTLGVAFTATGSFDILTRIVNPYSDGTNNSEQAGVWFGLNEDNYIKLVTANGGLVEMRVETGAASTDVNRIQALNVAGLHTNTVTLRLRVDVIQMTVKGYYQVGNGSEMEVGTLPITDALLNKASIDGKAVSYAGILATKRNEAASTTVVYSFEDFNLVPVSVNNLPVVANAIPNQTATVGTAFNFAFAENTFTDSDAGTVLTYTATLADDMQLPEWLTFNATDRSFSGTPVAEGTITIKVSASDGQASVSDEFTLTIAPADQGNTPPVVSNQIAAKTIPAGEIFSFTIPANTFTDSDVNDVLTYTASLADGTALPSWLTFNSENLAFSGTAPETAASLEVKVTATDLAQAFVSAPFTLTIETTPVPVEACTPISTLPCDQIKVNLPVAFDFTSEEGGLANTGFTMVDVPSARLAADGPVYNTNVPGYEPGKLSFNNGQLVITTNKGIQFSQPSGTPSSTETNSQINALGVGFVADQKVTIQTKLNGLDFSTSTGSGTNTSNNGYNSSQQAGLWFGLNENNYIKLVVIRDNALNIGRVQLFIEQTNASGGLIIGENDNVYDFRATSGITDLSTKNVILKLTLDPVARTATAVYQIEGVAEVILGPIQNVPDKFFTGVDHDNNGSTPLLSYSGVFATHRRALTSFNAKFDSFSITPVSTNNAPIVANEIPNQTAIEGAAFSFTFAENTFFDADPNSSLTYSATLADDAALPEWLIFDAANRTFTGTPAAGTAGSNLQVKITASDGQATANDIFTLTINAVAPGNTTPTVANPIAGLQANAAELFSFTIPANTFNDPDVGDELTYTTAMEDGSPLTGWLTFTGNTLSGTPSIALLGQTFSIRLTATDKALASVSTSFTITVVSAPVTVCSPISTLPCNQVVVSLTSPFVLDFNAAAGGLANTGFTMVDAPSARLAADDPVFNTNVPGYEPSKLEIANGQLKITTNRGIAYLKPATSPRTNSQINALGVGLNATTQKFFVETTIINPFVGTEAEQAGIWFGLDEDNYIKLVVNNGTIELRREIGAVSTQNATDVLNSGTTPIANIASSVVKLKLIIDNAANTAAGYYSLNGGAEIQVGGTATLSIPTLISGKTLGSNSSVSFAGIFATHRNAGSETSTTPLVNPPVYSFDNFKIEAVSPVVNILSFTPSSLNYTAIEGNTVPAQSTTLIASTGNPAISLTKSANSNWLVLPANELGLLSFDVNTTGLAAGTYTATVTASADGYTSATLAVNLIVSATTPVAQVIKINFQDMATVPPTGWLKDYGKPFGPRSATEQGTVTGAATYTYGWKKRTDGTPLDLSIGGTAGNGRNRLTATQYTNASEALKLQATLMHMQGDDPANFNGTRVEGYWEIQVPNGVYEVSLSVGDYAAGVDPESHTINIEGVNAINAFVPSGATGAVATRIKATPSPVRVTVLDGALTINASETIGGVTYNGINTKLNSVLIQPVSTDPYLYWSASTQNLLIESNTAETDKTFSLELSRSDNQSVQSALAVTYGNGGSNWLSFNATHNGTEPNVTFDYTAAKSLPVGTYTATVTASAESYTSATILVQITVVEPGSSRPYVISSTPLNNATGVALNPTIAANSLYVPEVPGFKGGVDNTTITNNTVKLLKVSGNTTTDILGTVQGTGGGDAISFSPSFALEPFTMYKFVVTDGVKSYSGAAFIPYEAVFTTGEAPTDPTGPLAVEFKPEAIPGTQGKKYTSVTFGPDGKFYAMRLDGTIERYSRNLATGQLSGMQEIKTLVNKYGSRSAVGLTFDPASTAQNLVLWVSHCSPGLTNAPLFDGNLSKLTGANLENEQLVLTKLPRSMKDHLVNSIAFGPDGAMYFNQGSNSSMGSYDGSWQRDESLLAGAVLRLDLNKLNALTLPLNVETTNNQAVINAASSDAITMSDGKYNPYATNSPLTIYASGVRNAYDLVWHSNGHLYIPTNGSAAGGNSPASVMGTRRPNGTFYSGPQVSSTTSIQVQRDWLFRVNPLKPVGYFGHPNPLRGEYVANRGYTDNTKYAVGTLPDENYRGAAFDFEFNKSPNGALEYKSNAFGGALKGWILVCRFSGGSDIIALKPGTFTPVAGLTAESNDAVYNIAESRTGSGTNGIPGLGGLSNPLDITEDVETGNLYVIEYNWNNTAGKATQLTLLKATAPSTPTPVAAVSPAQVIDNAVNGTTGATHTITIANTGNAPLSITAINLEGTDNAQFVISGLPASFPLSVAANSATTVNVAFKPTSTGVKTASMKVSSTNNTDKFVALRGLGTIGTGGDKEPSLQWILDVHNIPVNVGDDNKTNNLIHSTNFKAALLGEEISAQKFERAVDGPVTIELLSVFGPTSSNPIVNFGWYDSGNANSKHPLFSVSNSPESNGQTVDVKSTGSLSFDPATATFGFYSTWPFFSNRTLYSEDALNTFSGAIPHHVRVYPLKNPGGAVVENAYIVATEEHTSGFDFQDVVVIVRNVRPVGPLTAKKLEFNVPSLGFTLTPGIPVEAQTATLTASTGTPVITLTKSANTDWLVMPQSGLGSLSFGINEAGLVPGNYTATVTASSSTYESATIQVNLTVNQPQPIALIEVSSTELIFDGVKSTTVSRRLSIENKGTEDLVISSISIDGVNMNKFSFQVVNQEGNVTGNTIAPENTKLLDIIFAPGDEVSTFSAMLHINSNASNKSEVAVGLYAMSLNGFEGSNEPPLAKVVQTLGYNINVGWTTLADGTAATAKGEEVLVPLFEKAAQGEVTITPVARYSPNQELPFGFYTNNGSTPVRTVVGSLSGVFGQHQTLFPQLASGANEFDPGNAVFGLYVLGLQNRLTYTEDLLNMGGPAIHAVRTYPLKNRLGQLVPNSYLVCFEDASNGDYQDYVFVLSNVIPAGSRKTLAFNQGDLYFNVPQGGTTPAKTVSLTASTGTPEALTLTQSANSNWLQVPAAASGSLTFGINANGLQPGVYTATVTASATAYESASLVVNLTVTGLSANAIKVNFQMANSATPAGYLADIGLAYDPARRYGWVNPTTMAPKDHTASMRDRIATSTDEARLRTLALMQGTNNGQTPGSWEYALPNGLYNVSVSAGDPEFFDSNHTINVEGTTAISGFVPTTALKYRSATVTVEVKDGKLTVDANNGVNSKINYIIIDPTTPEGDVIPPVATVKFKGTAQSAGVYRNDVVVTVEASDAGGSGLASVWYSINNEPFVEYYSPILVSTAGAYSIRVKAIDGNKNETITNAVNFSVVVPQLNNTNMMVENLDKFPAADQLTFSRIQIPWQRTGTPYNENHDKVKVRISNKGTGVLTISNLNFSNTAAWKIAQLNNADYDAATMLPITVNPGAFVEATVQFVAMNQAPRVKVLHDTLYVTSNDDITPLKKVMLHGLWQEQGEGSNEPYAREIIDAFGFKSITGFNTSDGSNAGSTVITKTDEVPASFFVRADASKPVYVIQMGAYHGCCASTESFQWYYKGSTSNSTAFTHNGLDGQSLLPRKSGSTTALAEATFSPNTTAFGFKVASSYSDRTRNSEGKIGLRFWKALDANGNIIPNAYIIGHDYIGSPGVTNYDYQDNVFYVSNVRPETGAQNHSILAAAPSAAEFAPAQVSSNHTLTVTLTNTGLTYPDGSSDPAIQIKSVEIVGPNLNEFTVVNPASMTVAPQANTNITVGFRPNSRGIKNAALLVYYNNALSPLRIPLYGNANDACTEVTVLRRIKGAADVNVTINGKVWEADALFRKGSVQLDRPAATPIAATDDDVLYQTYLSATADKAETRYEIPMANGNYMVRMHLVENFFTAAASRVFNISIENELRLANLDIFREVGYKSAIVKDFAVTVTDGRLDVKFNPSVNRVAIAGLEIFGTTSNPDAIALSAQIIQGADCGVANGSVSLMVTKSTAASFLFKQGPNGVYQSSPVFNNLTVGQHTFYVKENVAGGCETSEVITVPAVNNTLSMNITAAPLNCNDLSGTATVAVTGGSGNYLVSWNTLPAQTGNTATGLKPGVYTITVTDNVSGCSKSQEVTITRVEDCVTTAIRINAGGAAYTAKNGNVFSADQYFTANNSFVYTNTSAGIANTEDDAMFQTERSSSTDKGSFTYNIPVQNGNHRVILHFAEIYSGTIGRRVMNVGIEGTTVLSNYDITAEVGFRTAVAKEFDANVKDGILTIAFSATADRPKVSAIEVISTFDKVNLVPTVNAGADKILTLPANTVSIQATATDTDGTIVTYTWAQVSGPSIATMTDATTPAVTVSNLAEGVYLFKVTVADNKGAPATDEVKVTVNPAPNQLPVANAGNNQSITLPLNSVSLNGSATDTDGTITGYAWSKVSGPAMTMTNVNAAAIQLTNLLEGTYVLKLTVTDNRGDIASDEVTIVVNPAPNQAPTANAGLDKTVTLPVNTITLTGTGADPENATLTYAWSKVSGPAATIVTPAAATTQLNSLVEGVYVFRLTVTDNKGAATTDDVTVTVNPANQAPVANAALDQAITLPVSTVSLTGSATDADGTIASYTWTQVAGPVTASFTSAATATTTVNGLIAAGTYEFKLTVTDNGGATATDNVLITVNPAPVISGTIRINAGGTQQTVNGVTWSGCSAVGSCAGYVTGGFTFSLNKTITGVPANMNQAIFQTEWTGGQTNGIPAGGVAFSYNIPVANGNYIVRLYFADLTKSGVGQRVFDVNIEGGAKELVNFDIVKEANGGLKVISREFPVSIADGKVTIDFIRQIENAKISAIEIVPNAASANMAPVANAGTNQTLTANTNGQASVTLNGTASVDPDGTIASYVWTIAGVQLATGANPIVSLGLGTHIITLTVTDNGGKTASSQLTVSVVEATACALPSPWVSKNIGAVSQAGEVCYNNGAFVVKASGSDIWNTSDQFRYVYQTLNCDGEIVAKVNSLVNTDSWAKAGVMIRESDAPNAKHAMMVITPSMGAAFQYRSATGAQMQHIGKSATAPEWVRIVRSGNTFTGYISENGSTWTQVGQANIAMENVVLAGLALTAHNNSALTTAEFANVAITAGNCIFSPIRINAGGPQVTLANGVVFSADKYFSNTYTYQNQSITNILDTQDDVLYKTERSANTDLGSFTYNIPVPQGNYKVRLHFAEIFWKVNDTGKRVFDVNIEGGDAEIAKYDIVATSGIHRAVIKEFNVSVSDQLLTIVFSAGANRPKISAIEVIADDSGAATPTAYSTKRMSNDVNAAQSADFDMLYLNVYPNPNDGYHVYLDIKGFGPEEKLTVEILDMAGSRIESYQVTTQENGSLSKDIILKHRLSSGVYLINVSSSSESVIQKLIVQ